MQSNNHSQKQLNLHCITVLTVKVGPPDSCVFCFGDDCSLQEVHITFIRKVSIDAYQVWAWHWRYRKLTFLHCFHKCVPGKSMALQFTGSSHSCMCTVSHKCIPGMNEWGTAVYRSSHSYIITVSVNVYQVWVWHCGSQEAHIPTCTQFP